MASRPAPSPLALGIAVGTETLDAVLLRPADDGVHVVGRLIRQRTAPEQAVDAEKLALALPGLKASGQADYTLEVGDGASAGTQFLPSEFGLSKKGSAAEGAAAGARTRPFMPQLREILHEVRASGHTVDRLAFTIAHPDTGAVPFTLADEAGKGRKATAPTDPKQLFARLKESYSGPLDAERVAFLPMAPLDDRPRMLGVVADPSEPVAESLRLLVDQKEDLPTGVSLDTETAVLADLVRTGAAPEPGTRTALVRVGTDDTLVLFFDGPDLLHVERLRSLTAYDLPDTVASRVLLQVDQKKVGALRSVYLTVAGRVEPLLDKFHGFFPEAAVEPAARLLAGAGLVLPDQDDDAGAFKTGALLATAAALDALGGPTRNLLPDGVRVRRRARALPPFLPTLLAGLLLVGLTAFGVMRFLGARAEVRALEAELMENPPVLPSDDPDRLQARVDSLTTAYNTYTRALNVLDSLLIGSDQWTQALRLVTRSTEATGGTWLIGWAPDPPNVRITGQSTSRPQIVDLTRRLGATIEMLEYTDVGPRRVYTFDMRMPAEQGLPEVARFLREVAASSPAARDSLAAAMAADTSAYVVDPVGHSH